MSEPTDDEQRFDDARRERRRAQAEWWRSTRRTASGRARPAQADLSAANRAGESIAPR